MKNKDTTIFVGVSGGVDSSVALLRLKKLGYKVVAVFIKTWQPDFITCTWKQERLDAMRVAASLDVPFLTFDAIEAYKQKVGEYMINEYKNGRTPNPDVMCNEFVKFGVFYDFTIKQGAEYVATGHYARVINKQNAYELHRGSDPEKDQSYFLWRIAYEQLAHIKFPIGDSLKKKVRVEAKSAKLPTFEKQDSQGVCFLGNIDMKDFLSHYIEPLPGIVYDTNGNNVGSHDGALFYTIGQRHGLMITNDTEAALPYYVVSKDLVHNSLIVDHTPQTCTGKNIELDNINLLVPTLPQTCEAQFRYRQKPFKITCSHKASQKLTITILDSDIELPSLGQSCVLYNGTHCLGGGVIHKIS